MNRIIERFFVVLCMLAVSTPVFAAAPIRIIVYGDSLTSGYQIQAEEAYPTKLDRKLREMGYTDIEVANMSIAGETTAGGLERLSSLMVKQPDIVVLELGGNDVIRGIDPDLIYKNLLHIIARLLEDRVYVVLLGVKSPPNMGYAYSQQVDAIYQRLASFYNLAYYPFVLEGVYGVPELNLADGYHPNGKGVEVMVENTYRYVDAGLRWKWDTMRYQQEFQRKWEIETMNAGSPSAPSQPDPAPSMQQQPSSADPGSPSSAPSQ